MRLASSPNWHTTPVLLLLMWALINRAGYEQRGLNCVLSKRPRSFHFDKLIKQPFCTSAASWQLWIVCSPTPSHLLAHTYMYVLYHPRNTSSYSYVKFLFSRCCFFWWVVHALGAHQTGAQSSADVTNRHNTRCTQSVSQRTKEPTQLMGLDARTFETGVIGLQAPSPPNTVPSCTPMGHVNLTNSLPRHKGNLFDKNSNFIFR